MTLSVKGLYWYMTFCINDTQHNNALHYAECRILFAVMLSIIILDVVMLSVVVLDVVMLSVVAPLKMVTIGYVELIKTSF